MNIIAVSCNTFLYFVCVVRRLAGLVDDLECFHHLFLPGGWRSVQGKKTFYLCCSVQPLSGCLLLIFILRNVHIFQCHKVIYC